MIPPTRYIDAGPGVPLANPQAAMVQGEAMARMGNTIQAIGEKGFQIAEKVRRIDEAGKMSALYANMEEDAAAFSLELMKREDTEAWPGEWKQRSQQWAEKASEAGLSPEAMATFQERFTNWNTQRSIGFETMAANKSLEIGRARIDNSLRYHAAHENWDAYQTDLNAARDSGILSSPEHERGLMDMEQKRAEADLTAAVTENPAAIVEAGDDTLRQQYPGSTPEMIRYAKQEAAKQKTRMATDTARSLEDEIYSDKPPAPERLEADPRFKQLKEGGNAKIAAMLQQSLAARYDDGIKRQRETPQYQSLIMGKVAKDIAALDVTDEMAVYEAESLLRQMGAGPMKNHLSGELSRRINGEPADSTAMGLNLRLVDDAFKNGFFKDAKPEQPARVEQLVTEGFLTKENLRLVGFDEEQANTILNGEDPAKQNIIKRLKAFENSYRLRADKQAMDKLRESDPFKAATVEAIVSGKPTVDYKSPETKARESATQWQAAASYAKTKKQILEWAKANPKKAEDIDAVRGELLRIIGPTLAEDFIQNAFDASGLDGGVLYDRSAPMPEPDYLPSFND